MKNKFNEVFQAFKFDLLREEFKKEQPTQQMKVWFEKRTNKHIKMVQDNWEKLYGTKFQKYLDELKDPQEHILKHDKSKFEEPEYTPYVFITWDYKKKADGEEYKIPNEMKQKATDATTYHVFNNAHHPVYWDDSKTMEDNVINDKDRDAAVEDEIVDATKMPNWAIIEMVCDWVAVSQERGTNSAKDWADKNIGSRWKFNDKQKKLIYELIEFFEEN